MRSLLAVVPLATGGLAKKGQHQAIHLGRTWPLPPSWASNLGLQHSSALPLLLPTDGKGASQTDPGKAAGAGCWRHLRTGSSEGMPLPVAFHPCIALQIYIYRHINIFFPEGQ